MGREGYEDEAEQLQTDLTYMLQAELLLLLGSAAATATGRGRLAQAAPAERATLGGPIEGLAIQVQAAAAEGMPAEQPHGIMLGIQTKGTQVLQIPHLLLLLLQLLLLLHLSCAAELARHLACVCVCACVWLEKEQSLSNISNTKCE